MKPQSSGHQKWESALQKVEDQRKSTRLPLHISVRYHLKDSSAPWIMAHDLDLSLTGVRIAIRPPVEMGAAMELDIKLPGIAQPFEISGKVKWVKPYAADTSLVECGISFENFKMLDRKDHFVHFMADKFFHLHVVPDPTVVARPAVNVEELKTAYQIIYKEYVKRGYCKPRMSAEYYSHFSLLPDSRTFVLEKEGEIRGTLSLIPDTPCGLPMESLFPEEISKLRKQGRKLAENTMLVLDQGIMGRGLFSLSHSKKHFYFFSLLKSMLDHARAQGLTDIVVSINPRHEFLYRFLTFEPLAPVRVDPSANGNPLLAMRWNIEDPVKLMPVGSEIRKYFSAVPTELSRNASYVLRTDENLAGFLLPIWKDMASSAQKHFLSLYPDVLASDRRKRKPVFNYEQAFCRNLGFLNEAEQQKLKNTTVAVAGLGGTGGVQAQALARLGIGKFILTDLDAYELANFNRQIGANMSTLGKRKTHVIRDMIMDVNPEAQVTVIDSGLSPETIDAFLDKVDVVIDALDFYCFEQRKLLYGHARQKGVWIVNCAPPGFGATLLVFDPKGMSLEEYFDLKPGMSKEELVFAFISGLCPAPLMFQYLDTKYLDPKKNRLPCIVPAFFIVAGLAATEVLKIVLGKGPLRAAPWVFQFDSMLQVYKKKYIRGGMRNPLMRLQKFFFRRAMARLQK